MRASTVLLGALVLAALGCERGRALRASDTVAPTSTTELTSAELPSPADGRDLVLPPEPVRGLVELSVPGEPASFLVGAPPRVAPRIVYLHGMCSGPQATLQSFELAARQHGGVLGLTGDKDCGGGLHSYTVDAEVQQQRLEHALASLGADGEVKRPEVVIGYSQGATVAERLASAYAYPFVVLIGAPREPSPDHLERARAVVMISGEKDMAKPKMKAAREACEAAGIPAHYIEMPGARHGELPDGDAVVGEALAWMREHARPLR